VRLKHNLYEVLIKKYHPNWNIFNLWNSKLNKMTMEWKKWKIFGAPLKISHVPQVGNHWSRPLNTNLRLSKYVWIKFTLKFVSKFKICQRCSFHIESSSSLSLPLFSLPMALFKRDIFTHNIAIKRYFRAMDVNRPR